MVLLRKLRKDWLRLATHLAALAPLAWTAWQYWQDSFVIDPVREITTRTGSTALILLWLSLSCTPLSTLTGFKALVRLRRPLGVYAFVYASLHFATFVGLDYGFDVTLLGQAIFEQRYVLVGFAAGVILLILAFTSTKGWQRRLGMRWKQLHRMVFLAGLLALIHYVWLVKDIRTPLRFGIVFALLLFLRIPHVRRAVSRGRHWLSRKLHAA
jgi:sulfoxide reductase heme-binding subunit YedZ